MSDEGKRKRNNSPKKNEGRSQQGAEKNMHPY